MMKLLLWLCCKDLTPEVHATHALCRGLGFRGAGGEGLVSDQFGFGRGSGTGSGLDLIAGNPANLVMSVEAKKTGWPRRVAGQESAYYEKTTMSNPVALAHG